MTYQVRDPSPPFRTTPVTFTYSPGHYSPTHYSPGHHSVSPPHYKQHLDYSTADKLYNLEEGQRKYEELIQENLWLKEQIDRKRNGQAVETHPVYYQQFSRGVPIGGDRTKNDVILWGMIERNRYLEEKINKLRKQQQKQSNSIRRIEQSQEWQTRHVCVPSKCYHEKYMQLLRVRSPFF